MSLTLTNEYKCYRRINFFSFIVGNQIKMLIKKYQCSSIVTVDYYMYMPKMCRLSKLRIVRGWLVKDQYRESFTI